MSFDLIPANKTVKQENVNQYAWAGIWLWLCQTYNERYLQPIPDLIIRSGLVNDGHYVDTKFAQGFAEILRWSLQNRIYCSPKIIDGLESCGTSSSGRHGNRGQRLLAFFSECDGFRIY